MQTCLTFDVVDWLDFAARLSQLMKIKNPELLRLRAIE